MKKILRFVPLFILIFLGQARMSFASPYELILDSRASNVDLAVSSQILSTSGSLTDYSGTFLYNPQDITNSRLEINADASKISFGTMPFDKMMLLTGLIRSIPNPHVSFVSESIAQASKNKIIVTGTALAGRNRESVSIPFEISELSKHSAVLKGAYNRTGPIGNKKNPQSQLFGSVNCRSLFTLVFKK